VAVSGLITLVSAAFSPASRLAIMWHAVPLPIRAGASSVAALSGLGTIVIAGALSRRQRRAWLIATVLLLVAVFAHVLKDLDAPSAGVSLGMALVLLLYRSEFDAKPGPGTVRRAVLALPVLAAVVWGFGVIAIMGHANTIRPHPGFVAAALSAAKGAVGVSLGLRFPGPTGRWIPFVLPILGLVAVATALVLLFRPAVEGLRRGPGDVERARELVHRFGRDTLAFFALREDKSYFFHGDVVIAYRYLWNLALVSGDPIGDPEQVPQAFEAFVRQARSLGWGVAVLAGAGELAEVYADLGLRGLYMGDEAVVDTGAFSLEGRAIRKVRQSCHRLERLGYSIEVLSDGDVSPTLARALAHVSRSWRGRAPERGFTMALGRGPSTSDPECLTVVARDVAGKPQAFLHLVPCFGPEPGYSLDMMRRRRDTPNGLMEWMVATAVLHLRERGARRLSLNFAAFAALFTSGTKLTPAQRVEAAFMKRISPIFRMEALLMFNAKFGPMWYPRYIYYETPLSIPRVGLAYLEAEAFFRLPRSASPGWRRRGDAPRLVPVPRRPVG